MKDLIAVILAAGRGTRMKSELPKVLHCLLGKPMIGYVLDVARGLGAREIVAVAGYKKHLLKDSLQGVKIVEQKELLGSGDALATARKTLRSFSGDLAVLCGDTPLIKKETIVELVRKHRNARATATVLTARIDDPAGYGRIRRDAHGMIEKIVEETEATSREKAITEINVGAYCFSARDLFNALDEIKPDNKKKEYFLTDVIEVLHNREKRIESIVLEKADTIIGINSRRDLAEATKILRMQIIESHMASGVTIVDPSTTTIEPGAKIGRDTVIYPYTVIESGVEVGRSCQIGPFARLRGGVRLSDRVEVGNFVELVRTCVGSRTKIKHHTYLGDTVVGKSVNIGAGTITANFDGRKKNTTIIEDGSFIGVGSILIAPVTIGKGSTVGAGCVVPKRHDVPPDATVVGVPARVLRAIVSKKT